MKRAFILTGMISCLIIPLCFNFQKDQPLAVNQKKVKVILKLKDQTLPKETNIFKVNSLGNESLSSVLNDFNIEELRSIFSYRYSNGKLKKIYLNNKKLLNDWYEFDVLEENNIKNLLFLLN